MSLEVGTASGTRMRVLARVLALLLLAALAACEWPCADYEGKTAALTLHVWATCAGVIPIDRECAWTCYVRASEARPACPDR